MKRPEPDCCAAVEVGSSPSWLMEGFLNIWENNVGRKSHTTGVCLFILNTVSWKKWFLLFCYVRWFDFTWGFVHFLLTSSCFLRGRLCWFRAVVFIFFLPHCQSCQHSVPEAAVSCCQTPAGGNIQQPTQCCQLWSGDSRGVAASKTWDLNGLPFSSWLCHFYSQEKRLSGGWQYRTFARTLRCSLNRAVGKSSDSCRKSGYTGSDHTEHEAALLNLTCWNYSK